ncbi:cytosine/adenosine deaminase-related metal-dependent hydrolase [Luteibacter sp. Sphag1AF]|uniref:amidohydrolase family protein n=1 Tax=Luteibacter sp. Sphag1AF TaxID=2587031 RepID=UPI00161AE1FD|nr:amidohydrolase family protein [Luteibacter sp. Sphag1AF]MBB3228866.1 cytosine/adenosine deaminase-related metal-dependent hydrolase [Luteibacter sp. Sphag1AF]
MNGKMVLCIAGALLAGISMAASAADVVTCVSGYVDPHKVCNVTAKAANGRLAIRSNILAGEKLLLGGTVQIGADGRIESVGCDAVAPDADTTQMDCPGEVVTPGLINLHEHLNYSTGEPLKRPANTMASHRDWQADPSLWPGDLVNRTGRKPPIALVELRHLASGTTTLAGRGGAKGLTRNPDAGWFAPVKNITFPFGRGTKLPPEDCTQHRILSSSHPTLVHAGEGTDAASRRELACLLESRETYAQTEPLTLVHAVAVDDELAARMARTHTAMLWSPRSNMDLYNATAPIGLLQSKGVSISLGTDWMPSGSTTLLDEARFARALRMDDADVTSESLLAMMTSHPASALGMTGQIGVIAPGAQADLAAFRVGDTDPGMMAVEVIESRSTNVHFVMVGGKMKYVSAQLTSWLADFSEADACMALPKNGCTGEGYACGAPVLKRAFARPDAALILCPTPPPELVDCACAP